MMDLPPRYLAIWCANDLEAEEKLLGLYLVSRADAFHIFRVSMIEAQEFIETAVPGHPSYVPPSAETAFYGLAANGYIDLGLEDFDDWRRLGADVVGRINPEVTEADKRRARVLSKTGGRCYYCGFRGPIAHMQLDHFQPRSRGGSDRLCNMVPACTSCNQRKGNRTVEEYRVVIAAEQGLDARAFKFFWEREA